MVQSISSGVAHRATPRGVLGVKITDQNGDIVNIKNWVEGGTQVSEILVQRRNVSRSNDNRLMIHRSEHDEGCLYTSDLGWGGDMIMRNTIFNEDCSSTPARGWVGPVIPVAVVIRDFERMLWSQVCFLY
ncbi:hypothetical protein TNCV_3771871 [Trichonephila clavipes]|nr:hypothetical protein TNCV_3771871 [Trichonephila clavipes]